MSLETVSAAISWLYRSGLAAPDLSLVWHAGEPLVLPPAWYRAAINIAAKALPPSATLKHCVQTNAILIDDRWCDLFLETGMQVGVSLDGPAALHDRRRRTRRGTGTHSAAMRGVATLRRRGVEAHAICVVTEATLDQPEALIDFFAAAGIRELGLNVEEIEGANGGSSLAAPGIEVRFRAFFERVIDRAAQAGVMLREVRDVFSRLPRTAPQVWPGNDQNTPFSNVTVAWNGALHTFSPELAGFVHPRLGPMVLGNVHTDTLADVLAGCEFRGLWGEIAEGVAACAGDCPYFSLCRGGEPSNKLAELGTMAGTETMSCRLAHRAVAEAVLGRLLRLGIGSPAVPAKA